jgi:hypothetical protein
MMRLGTDRSIMKSSDISNHIVKDVKFFEEKKIATSLS